MKIFLCEQKHCVKVQKLSDENYCMICKVSKMLKVMSDETRLKILYSLLKGEKCVCELQELTNSSQSLISHQLASLRKANLIGFRKDGNRVFYALKDEHVKKILDIVQEHVLEEVNEKML